MATSHDESATGKALLVDAWALQQKLDTGGTSSVWLGRSTTTGTTAAVKVITNGTSNGNELIPFFVREVRALASMRHPNILNLLDYGVVSDVAAEASRGELPARSPYLVFEYASGGGVDARRGLMNWPELLSLLRAVLRGLAHAHARGIIHRDVKPENMLFPTKERLADEVRLADFGIAHIAPAYNISRGRFVFWTGERVVGTPAYMAPEQVDQDWIAYGPQTDLYSLGIIAWELASGRLPWPGTTYMQLAHHHRRSRLPPLDPQFDVPDAFERWVQRLTQKQPSDRFPHAMDALTELNRLVTGHGHPLRPSADDGSTQKIARVSAKHLTPPIPNELPVPRRGRTANGHAVATPIEMWSAVDTATTLQLVPASGQPHRAGRAVVYRAQVPEPPSYPPTPAELADFPGILPANSRVRDLMLPVPADTANDRRSMWSAMQRVWATGTPEAIVLEFRPDNGATALARWLAQTGEEFGIASVVRVTHHVTAVATDGFAFGLAARFRLFGYPVEWLHERLVEKLTTLGFSEPQQNQQLATWIVSHSRLEGHVAGTPPQPTEAVRAQLLLILRRLAEDRPLIVWCEGASADGDTQRLIEDLLHSPSGSSPILFLLAPPPDCNNTSGQPLSSASATVSGRVTRIRPLGRGETPVARADAIDAIGLARAAFRSGDIDTAHRLATEVVRQMNPENNRPASSDGIATEGWQAERLMADIAHERQQFVQAAHLYQASLQRTRITGRRIDERERGELELSLARSLRHTGRLNDARELAEQALKRIIRSRAPHMRADALNELAQIHFESRDWPRANRLFSDAEQAASESLDRGLQAVCRMGLGKVELLRSNWQRIDILKALLDKPDGASESCLNRVRLAVASHVVRIASLEERELLCTQVLEPLSRLMRAPSSQEAHALLLGCDDSLTPDHVLEQLTTLDENISKMGFARLMFAENLLWVATNRVDYAWYPVTIKATTMALAQFTGLCDAAGIARCRSIMDP
jgi:serine/threonine protein kinase/tetratricopeptide (TPR) repeat protein